MALLCGMTSETMTETSADSWQEIYNKLGFLYYGVVTSSEAMNPDTNELMRKCVNRFWAQSKDTLPGFQGYTPNKVDAMFDWLGLNDADWEYCINEFAFIAKRHKDTAPAEVKEFVNKSARDLARLMGLEPCPALDRLNGLFD